MRLERGLQAAWLAVVLASAGLLAWRLPQAQLQTSIFELVPWQARHPAAEDGAAALRGQLQRKAMVLVGRSDEAGAIAAAEAYAAALSGTPGIAGVACAVDEAKVGAALGFFEPWRASLYTREDRGALRGDGTALLNAAEQGLYLPPGFSLSLGFGRDPFGTYGRWLAQRGAQLGRFGLSQGHMVLSDGALSYAAVLLDLGERSGGMAGAQALAAAFAQADRAARRAGASSVLRAGFVFHELAAAAQAHAEVSRIGSLSMLLLALLAVVALPQWGPRLLTFAPVLLGSLAGAAAVLLFWRQVHVIALVFGATVVGVAEDYGLYYLCGVYDPGPWDAQQRRRDIQGPSALALGTSVLGYATLLFLPIPALQQVAVFAMVGLSLDWAGVLLWYPALLGRAALADPGRLDRAAKLSQAWPQWGRQRWLAPLLGAVTLLSLIGVARLKVDDDLRLLYARDARLDAEQQQVTRLTGVGSASGFFVLSAPTEQALLRLEEAALDRLDQDPADGRWSGVSRLVPSVQRQLEDRAALERALFGPPAVARRLQERLGGVGLAARLKRALGAPPPPLKVDDWLASPVSAPYRHLWRGRQDGTWRSLLACSASLDAEGLQRAQGALAGMPGVLYVDQLGELAGLLGSLRRSLSWALGLGALVVLAALIWRLRSMAWAAALPTALGALAALGVLGFIGLPFNLFALMGLILLLGTGIDFGIYIQAAGARRLSSFVAVNLGALTNIAAVGVLAFSGTRALQGFGTVLAVGALVAWLTAPCFRARD